MVHAAAALERLGDLEIQALLVLAQGSAADLFKETMVNVAELLRAWQARTRIVLSVRDELVFYVPPEELELVAEIQTVMERPSVARTLLVLLIVDVAHAETNWEDKRKGLPR